MIIIHSSITSIGTFCILLVKLTISAKSSSSEMFWQRGCWILWSSSSWSKKYGSAFLISFSESYETGFCLFPSTFFSKIYLWLFGCGLGVKMGFFLYLRVFIASIDCSEKFKLIFKIQTRFTVELYIGLSELIQANCVNLSVLLFETRPAFLLLFSFVYTGASVVLLSDFPPKTESLAEKSLSISAFSL